LLSVLLPATPVGAQVVILHSFAGGASDGKTPFGSLTPSGSTLFGLTSSGGTSGPGTVFRINADGTGFGLLHSFAGGLTDGQNPTGSLTLSGPTLYGMTLGGGSALNDGTVVKINTDGTSFGLLHAFVGGASDGRSPLGSLAQSGPTLYGMTFQGGTADLGTVFKINVDGTGFTVLHSFTGGPADGQAPSYSSLVVSGSTLYGMTGEGGTAGLGTLFKVNADGTGFAVLHSFVAATGDGWAPAGSLILNGSTLYGMTEQGGGAAGTVFRINTDGTGYATLHSFLGSPTDGANPLGDLLLVGSTLYGMTSVGGTSNLGTVFQIGTDGTGYNVLHSFTGAPADGNDPQGSLTLLSSTLYGMTSAGGGSNFGTIFSISVPEPRAWLLAGAGAAAVAIIRMTRRPRPAEVPS
jgi:uncharacterized repeat protein (TIGR03803 family)